MHASSAPRFNLRRAAFSTSTRATLAVLAATGACALVGCAHGSRSPAPPKVGQTTITSGEVPGRVERIVIAEKGALAAIGRKGCLAALRTGKDQTGSFDELRVRCPKPDRLAAWFAGLERVVASVPLEREPESEDDNDNVPLPSAELITSGGAIMRVVQPDDTARVIAEVQALQAELAASEEPTPGPASPAGWQMLRLSGPAHVMFGGAPATGVLDARMSTSGQYLCEFVAQTREGPLRATKSGWIPATAASHAIDEVLVPFKARNDSERNRPTYAAAVADGTESRADATSTAAVFERFAAVQDALGDACLPELEPPAPVGL